MTTAFPLLRNRVKLTAIAEQLIIKTLAICGALVRIFFYRSDTNGIIFFHPQSSGNGEGLATFTVS